ncbi:MAG: hypothetical protein PHX43_07585 [Alphaproteobacteria bacterium]|nr:hypothetical protein [Alphaproteobacteria bacterium]
MQKLLQLFVVAVLALTPSIHANAANGIDSSPGVNLPISAGGFPVAIMQTDGNAVFSKNIYATGGIQPGTVSSSCTTALAGMMRYNATDKVIEYCNGASWSNVSGGGGNCPSIVVGGSNQVTIPAGIPLQLFVWSQSYSSGGGSHSDPVNSYMYHYYQCINGAWTYVGG